MAARRAKNRAGVKDGQCMAGGGDGWFGLVVGESCLRDVV